MRDLVRVDVEDGIARCVLSRPEKKNAMNPAMHEQMGSVLAELKRENLTALVLTGDGDSFCAGMDLEECFLDPWDDPVEFFRVNEELAYPWFIALKEFPAVTVARVNGYCFGGGVELVGLCDLAVASEDAVFGLSEVNFGTFPGGGTTWAVAHNLARKDAMYLMLTGETFSGRVAEEISLVNVAVPHAELDSELDRILGLLASKSSHTLSAIKHVYEESLRMTLRESIDWETARLFQLAYQARDEWVQKGLRQFQERRYKPGRTSFDPDT